MAVLSIDQGTSGTKAIVVDGSVIKAVVEVPVRPAYLDNGGVEVDPQELLDSVVQAGTQACAEAGVTIEAVALANQGETVLAWDPHTGDPLSTALVWQDSRASVICDDLRHQADFLAERTGLVLDPYFSAPKMTWLRRHLTTSGVVTTSDAWLLHQLAGVLVTDHTTASRSLIYNIADRAWDSEALRAFDLDDEPLPRIARNDEIIGSTSVFGGDLPIAGVVVDQQAALFAESCFAPGQMKCTYGTGAFLLANVGISPTRSSSGLTTSVAWSVQDQTDYCIDGQVYTAASAVRWLEDLGLIGGPSELDSLASSESGGVQFVPALAGLAAPWWQPDATAALMGMRLSTSRGDIVRAVIDGVAANVAELVALVARDSGVPVDRLRVDGGLTRSSVLMQTQADLLQAPVEIYPSAHATALGAAALCRRALDPALSSEDAVGAWEPIRTYEPLWSVDQAESVMDAWRSAVSRAAEQGQAGGLGD